MEVGATEAIGGAGGGMEDATSSALTGAGEVASSTLTGTDTRAGEGAAVLTAGAVVGSAAVFFFLGLPC